MSLDQLNKAIEQFASQQDDKWLKLKKRLSPQSSIEDFRKPGISLLFEDIIDCEKVSEKAIEHIMNSKTHIPAHSIKGTVKYKGDSPFEDYPSFHVWIEVPNYFCVLDFTIGFHLEIGKHIIKNHLQLLYPLKITNGHAFNGLIYKKGACFL